MGRKYFVWSFDDGVTQDRQVVETLREYGLGATFHLNSGLFGQQTYIVYGHGFIAEIRDPEESDDCPFVPHFRLTAEEAKSLYQGFEVAAHTCTHQDLSRCPADVRRREIEDDVAALSWLFRCEIAGFAYPYGKGADESRDVLREAGVRYARTVDPAPDFRFPTDPLRLPITCRQSDPRFFSRLEDFFRSEAEADQLFLAFAHSYEFDFGDKHSSWERFRRICEIVARQPGLKCCSIREALESQTA